MPFLANDPLTQRILALFGLGSPDRTGEPSLVPASAHRTTLKRSTVPASTGVLVAGFAETPAVDQGAGALAAKAIKWTKQVYSIYTDAAKLGKTAISSAEASELEPTALEFGVDLSGAGLDVAPTVTLAEVSGGELALGTDVGIEAAAGGTAAAGAGGSGGAGGAGAAATGLGTLVAGVSVAGIMAAVTYAVAYGVHTLLKAVLPKDLPLGRNTTAANNIVSQKSRMIGMAGEQAVIEYIKTHINTGDLLRLAMAGPNLSPHGEVLFHHPIAGSGGSFYNQVDPAYDALLTRVWNGDVSALKDFVSGVEVYYGETGATHPSWDATDWYRRTLVYTVPKEVQNQLEPLFLLWQPTPSWKTERESVWAYLFPGGYPSDATIEEVKTAGGIDLWLEAFRRRNVIICTYFRDPAEYTLSDDDVSWLARSWQQIPYAYNPPAISQKYLAYSDSGGGSD